MKRLNRWAVIAALMGLGGMVHAAPLAKIGAKPAAAKKDAAKSVFEEDWLDIDESMDGPKASDMKLDDEIAGSFFLDEIPGTGSFPYGYGGRTVSKILPSSAKGNKAVFAAYMDNDWSGIALSVGVNNFIDLTPYRKTGSLTFWVKGGPNVSKFMVGLLDNQGGDKKVQTKVSGDGYAVLKEGEWIQVRIPLKAFLNDGMYWDAKGSREVAAKVDWTKIQEFRISIGKDENKVGKDSKGKSKPVIMYLDQIQLTKTSNGIDDPEAYWDAFKSNEPDKLVTDFTKWGDMWKGQHGNSAKIKVGIAPIPSGAPESVKGQALKIDFHPGDWYDAFLQTSTAPGMFADWSKHYGVTVWLHTEKPFQSFDFVILDRDREMFLARVGAGRGWNQILIPFRDFGKFPYYQPPEAKQNNKLDLDGIFQVGIKPGGEVPGIMHLASVGVTNQRELAKVKKPAELPAVFKGDLAKSVKKIPDIYGINVGLWAPELIDPNSLSVQKQLNMGVVRYPGGLRSDEEDWEKTLKDKDFHVDTDEFLDWCEKASCKPMFTANIGDGDAARAARWVEYVNKRRKGPKVVHWELGNEMYGNWHKYYDKWGKDGGVAYAKATKEYVKAMKAVDPSIKITVVWMLGGSWNKTLFKEIADIVDGVNVHHYAQNAGSENDEGLLATSSEADELMREVKKQVDEYGVKGKKYEIWLTEWNSVDFNPGPQILQHVQGLFVADYLGNLAESPIDVANMWALYNGRDKRLGDYSLLARDGDPQGYNFRRPAYWGFKMVSGALTGTLLAGGTDQEQLSGWMSKREDGKVSLVFVNKNSETDYKTTIKVPGLKGQATVEVLTVDNSGGIRGNEPMGDTYDGSGPKSEKKAVADGAVLVIPKHSVVTVKF
ncbi:MAG TPA: carbohydrate binding domain-containing protein [Fibrobacteria bacterium]|nr:carbohydrate binding domain-containing protein [Fibrobacteria bacterium]